MNTKAIRGQRSAVSGKKGFTLVELVLVIILIAILSSIAVPRFVNLSRQADIAATRGAIGAIRGAIVMDYASRTLVNRGVAKFSNVVYSSWFFELDVPTNELTNSSVVTNAVDAAGTVASTACPASVYPYGQKCGGNMRGQDINAAGLLARNTVGAVDTPGCDWTGTDQVPLTGWYYESNGDFEGVVKACGDSSDDAGFVDDLTDVW